MRKIALLAAVAATVMAFANVSSASALSWSPQGTTRSFETSGTYQLQGEQGFLSLCTQNGSWSGQASGAVFNFATNLNGNCTWNGYATHLALQGLWSLTATGTSTTTLKGDTSPSGGTVMTLTISSGGEPCTVTARGPITLSGIPYSSYQLKLDNWVPISTATTWCAPMFGKALKITGTFTAPGLTILP